MVQVSQRYNWKIQEMGKQEQQASLKQSKKETQIRRQPFYRRSDTACHRESTVRLSKAAAAMPSPLITPKPLSPHSRILSNEQP